MAPERVTLSAPRIFSPGEQKVLQKGGMRNRYFLKKTVYFVNYSLLAQRHVSPRERLTLLRCFPVRLCYTACAEVPRRDTRRPHPEGGGLVAYSFFGGKESRTALSIEGDGLRYLEIERRGGVFRVLSNLIQPLPPGTVQQELLGDPTKLLSALEELRARRGRGFILPVYVGLPSRDVMLRVVELPGLVGHRGERRVEGRDPGKCIRRQLVGGDRQ